MEDIIALVLSAKYSAIIMETSTGLIIGYTLLSKEDWKVSATLEPMAVKSRLAELLKERFRIDSFISGISTSVEKVIVGVNQKYGILIKHEFDCWLHIKILMVKICDIKILYCWLKSIKIIYGFHTVKQKGTWSD